MNYLDHFRGEKECAAVCAAIAKTVTRPWTLMEVCGGQTHTIVKYGLDELLPAGVELLHGPGCPVCVTPLEKIDKALELARLPELIFCAFGDMLRVPGSDGDLLRAKAEGADVRLVYSPLDALKIAQAHPARQVAFFAVGFETTAPVCALAAWQAREQKLENFTLLVSHVLVPPAIEALMAAPACRVQGFLAAGHVCTVMGYREYEPLAAKHRVPIVVTGFEPLDILQGILLCVRQLEEGRAEVENQYARSVKREGTQPAQIILRKVFRVADRQWRGLGVIPQSGLVFREEFAAFDAERRFVLEDRATEEPAECVSGLILQGVMKPADCPAFGARCTPEHPLGATMVSTEGACAAYHRYRRKDA